MENIRTKISNFIDELKKEHGSLPKWNYGNSPDKLFYNTPYMDNREIVSAIETLLFSPWAAAGPKVKEFEDEFSKLIKNKHTVSCSSGSDADLLMITALKEYYNWPDGSNLLISIAGFPTTYSSVVFNNLKCNFVDLEKETLNFDLEKLEKQINENTVGIYISAPLGNLPNLEKLKEISEKYNLVLIGDGCDSLGSTYNNKELNEYCVATSCSLYMAHHISVIAGGLVSTDNKKISDIVRSLSRWGHGCWCRAEENLIPQGKCGSRFSEWIPEIEGIQDHKYTYVRPEYNSQLLDLQGAIGLEQIKKISEIHAKRKDNKSKVENLFKKYIPNIDSPKTLPNADISWFGTCLICPTVIDKLKLVQYLEKNGVQTRDFFGKNILTQPGFKNLGDWKNYPVANDILYRLFFVGANPNYTVENFEHLKSVLKKYEN